MIRLRQGLVAAAFFAMLSLNAESVKADQYDDAFDAIDKERAEEEAKVAEWAKSRNPKPDTPCMTAWKENSANHSCISSAIMDGPNNECTFTSITCPRVNTSPNDEYSTESKGDASSIHVRTSVIYENLTVHINTVRGYFNCDGVLTVKRSINDLEPCKK
ncbi:MAG TPA: hypothetical protein VNV36_09785 [Pseudomonas sp.]|uniref:hypothetical protein n=1 Tax=Pseudomonas sp. TaxID=306 RepID=UPI002CCE9B87|nr:hypothetical protein [Pseudomonas sp.]HWH87053.1 hypothetical protein [Pseudomonas sp.]